MNFDELEARKQERLIEDWAKLFDSSLESISQLGGRFRGDSKCFLVSKHCGSFNFCVRMHWKDGGPDWLIRFPIPGKTVFPEKKFSNKVATMKFIRERTSIPVPKVIAHGTAADNNTGLGPFIIMTWIEGKNMKELMQIPSVDGDKSYESGDIMRPDIDRTTLSALYGQMTSVLLELSTIKFDRIGSLDFHQPSN